MIEAGREEEEMKMSSCFKDKKNIKIIYSVMVLLQLALIVYCFACKREGWHQDELWSYGFANSHAGPTIYYSDIYAKEAINIDEWADSELLWNYLVVDVDKENNVDERFSYDFVYYNQITDLSPPLYSMILHTICSFFPNSFSWWYAFSINMIAFLITMLFLWKACCEYRDEGVALIVGFLFGFSRGCVDTFIYLRMYGMLTALFAVIVYYFIKILKSREKSIPVKWLICIYIISFAMFFTHMYPIIVTGILTFLTCLLFLCKKEIKKMFQFGLTMLAALISFFLAYPSFLRNITVQVGNNMEKLYSDFDFETRVKTMLNCLFGEVFNIMIPYYESGFLRMLPYILIYAFLVCLPLLFLFRKSDKLRKMPGKIKLFFKNFKDNFLCWYRKWDWIWMILLTVLLLTCIAIGMTVNIAHSTVYVDKYVSYIRPAATILVVVLVDWLLKKLLKKSTWRVCRKVVLGSLSVICVAVSLYIIADGSAYYFKRDCEGIGIEAAATGSNVIMVHRNLTRITALMPDLLKSKAFFSTTQYRYMEFSDDYLEKIASGERMILILHMEDFRYVPDGINDLSEAAKMVVDEEKLGEILDYFDALVPNSKLEFLTSETLVAGEVRVYLINP